MKTNEQQYLHGYAYGQVLDGSSKEFDIKIVEDSEHGFVLTIEGCNITIPLATVLEALNIWEHEDLRKQVCEIIRNRQMLIPGVNW